MDLSFVLFLNVHMYMCVKSFAYSRKKYVHVHASEWIVGTQFKIIWCLCYLQVIVIFII